MRHLVARLFARAMSQKSRYRRTSAVACRERVTRCRRAAGRLRLTYLVTIMPRGRCCARQERRSSPRVSEHTVAMALGAVAAETACHSMGSSPARRNHHRRQPRGCGDAMSKPRRRRPILSRRRRQSRSAPDQRQTTRANRRTLRRRSTPGAAQGRKRRARPARRRASRAGGLCDCCGRRMIDRAVSAFLEVTWEERARERGTGSRQADAV